MYLYHFVIFLRFTDDNGTVEMASGIERFRSCGQQLCKCNGSKESINIRKHIDLLHFTNMEAVSFFQYTNMAVETSCMCNALYHVIFSVHVPRNSATIAPQIRFRFLLH